MSAFSNILLQSRSSEATNIGYRFSSRAVFGWILFELNSGCEDLRERVEIFCLLSEYCRSNHILYSQSFSNKQKTSASVPKSSHFLFNSSSPATAQKPLLPIRHICGLGASVGCERIKRTFNTPRLKSQICLIGSNGFVCSLSNELNSNLKYHSSS